MPSPTSSAGRDHFLRQLAAIAADPAIRRLALSRARDPEIAADAIQEAYCAVAGRQTPEEIDDLRKYFCRVLINEIYRLLRPQRTTPLVNVEEMADACHGRSWGLPPTDPFDEILCTQLITLTLLRRLDERRESITLRVPGRSPDPRRYRELIVACARDVLVATATGDVSDADSPAALRVTYPAWFAEEGCGTANVYQRVKRARDDVRALLLLISRDLYL